MKRRKSQPADSALELIEQATHLLRLAPVSTLANYYIGALPFVLGLLYFWSDMSRGAFAHRHAATEALGLALLFLWMKTWQAVFAANLRARLCGGTGARWTLRRWCRVALVQTFLQPLGLFLVPVAFVLTIFFPWVYAFFQNVTVLGDGELPGVRTSLGTSWRQTWLWPRQNFATLATLALFSCFVLINVFAACLILPHLPKTILGLESAVTRSPWSLLNTTFLTAVFGLTWLCLDPLFKALYVLRCFYGESLQSAADLKAELRRSQPPNTLATVLVVLLLGVATPVVATVPANLPPPVLRPPPSAVSPPDLDRSIKETLNQREYSWRLPREKIPDKEEGGDQAWLGRFFDHVNDTLKSWGDTLKRWYRKFDDWLSSDRRHSSSRSGAGGGTWLGSVRVLIVALLIILACIVAVFLLRLWQRRGPKEEIVEAEAIVARPDVSDDRAHAAQLPEDGWLRLARELLDRGEWRLALRAFYFASLAHLAQRNLISLAQFKSNRDYQRELDRRAHALPEVVATFGHVVSDFDRVWYGNHLADTVMLDQFAAHVNRIKSV